VVRPSTRTSARSGDRSALHKSRDDQSTAENFMRSEERADDEAGGVIAAKVIGKQTYYTPEMLGA